MIHYSHKSHSPSVTHRYCISFFPKPPLAIEKSCLYIWHLIFSYNCFLNNLLERFTFLLLVFLFCLIHITKLNLTHQSKVFFCLGLYFALFTLFLLQQYQQYPAFGLNYEWLVLFLYFISNLHVQCINFFKLNQTGKWFLNMHCKVYKDELWQPRKIEINAKFHRNCDL